MAETFTFIILKPDTIKRHLVGKIISELEYMEIKLQTIDTRLKNKDWYHWMYNHVPVTVFEEMESFLVGAPLIGISAIYDSEKTTPKKIKDFIRRSFIIDGFRNLIHISDNEETALHEHTKFLRHNSD